MERELKTLDFGSGGQTLLHGPVQAVFKILTQN
jgi:hypothetical protein